MAVTINTIPAQTGELVRALVTVGVGGANSANRNWYRASTSTGSVSADTDFEIDSGLVINRVLWHSSDQLRFFKSGSGSFSLAVTSGGVLAGKSVLFAVNDAGDAIDAQFDIDTASISAITNRLGLNTNAAQTAAFNTVVTGGLVNIVISDPPGTAPAVDDSEAALAARAGDPTAALGATAVEPPPDSEAALTARAGNPAATLGATSIVPPPDSHAGLAARAGSPTAVLGASAVTIDDSHAGLAARAGNPTATITPSAFVRAALSARAGSPTATVTPSAIVRAALSARAGDPTVAFGATAVVRAALQARAGNPTAALTPSAIVYALLQARAGDPTVSIGVHRPIVADSLDAAGAFRVDPVRYVYRVDPVRYVYTANMSGSLSPKRAYEERIYQIDLASAIGPASQVSGVTSVEGVSRSGGADLDHQRRVVRRGRRPVPCRRRRARFLRSRPARRDDRPATRSGDRSRRSPSGCCVMRFATARSSPTRSARARGHAV